MSLRSHDDLNFNHFRLGPTSEWLSSSIRFHTCFVLIFLHSHVYLTCELLQLAFGFAFGFASDFLQLSLPHLLRCALSLLRITPISLRIHFDLAAFSFSDWHDFPSDVALEIEIAPLGCHFQFASASLRIRFHWCFEVNPSSISESLQIPFVSTVEINARSPKHRLRVHFNSS